MGKIFDSLKKLMGVRPASVVQETYGEDLLPTARVENDPTKVTVEKIELPKPSAIEEKQSRERHHKLLKRRYKNFTEGVDIFKNFQWIDIEIMDPCASNWRHFDDPDDKEFITLIGSIETVGILQPLILVKEVNGSYTIIDGLSRALASYSLYKTTKNEKYKFAPAFVLEKSEVDEYYLRIMALDTNANYRTLSQENLIKGIIERHELLKRSKQFRSESNIAEILAQEFMMSKSSIYNYLCLKKLREEVMVLLLEKTITLQSARYLSRVNHDVQLMILENFGVERINEAHRIKFLTNKDNVKLPELMKRIKIANDLVPHKVEVTVTMEPRMLKDYLEIVSDFKSSSIVKYENVFQTQNSDKYCKVSYDEEKMKFYLEKDIIDQKLLDKVNAKNYQDLKRCRG